MGRFIITEIPHSCIKMSPMSEGLDDGYCDGFGISQEVGYYSLSFRRIFFEGCFVPGVRHEASDALVDHHPGPDQQHCGVVHPEDEEEDGVDQDLHGVVGTRDQGEQSASWNGVLGRVGNFELSKCSVSIQLLSPGHKEDATQDTEDRKLIGSPHWNSNWCCSSTKCEARCFTQDSCSCAEVVSKADDVVGDVHGGLASLVHSYTLIESAEALEREEDESNQGCSP